MTDAPKKLPLWILIVSGLFALMEIMVSLSMCFAPESTLEKVDFSAQGVEYVVKMWAVRQFALGVIFAFATLKRSAPMLFIAYLFFLVMFIGDFVIGVTQQETAMIISAVVMCAISIIMMVIIHKKK